MEIRKSLFTSFSATFQSLSSLQGWIAVGCESSEPTVGHFYIGVSPCQTVVSINWSVALVVYLERVQFNKSSERPCQLISLQSTAKLQLHQQRQCTIDRPSDHQLPSHRHSHWSVIKQDLCHFVCNCFTLIYCSRLPSPPHPNPSPTTTVIHVHAFLFLSKYNKTIKQLNVVVKRWREEKSNSCACNYYYYYCYLHVSCWILHFATIWSRG